MISTLENSSSCFPIKIGAASLAWMAMKDPQHPQQHWVYRRVWLQEIWISSHFHFETEIETIVFMEMNVLIIIISTFFPSFIINIWAQFHIPI